MLGEKLGESIGQITGIRVLAMVAGAPHVEASFEADGTLLGIHYTERATYESTGRADGSLFGEGQGLLMCETGDVVAWKGSGVGHFEPTGAQKWSGAIYFETAAPALARLNGVACLFEYKVDEGGKTEATLYEWT